MIPAACESLFFCGDSSAHGTECDSTEHSFDALDEELAALDSERAVLVELSLHRALALAALPTACLAAARLFSSPTPPVAIGGNTRAGYIIAGPNLGSFTHDVLAAEWAGVGLDRQDLFLQGQAMALPPASPCCGTEGAALAGGEEEEGEVEVFAEHMDEDGDREEGREGGEGGAGEAQVEGVGPVEECPHWREELREGWEGHEAAREMERRVREAVSYIVAQAASEEAQQHCGPPGASPEPAEASPFPTAASSGSARRTTAVPPLRLRPAASAPSPSASAPGGCLPRGNPRTPPISIPPPSFLPKCVLRGGLGGGVACTGAGAAPHAKASTPLASLATARVGGDGSARQMPPQQQLAQGGSNAEPPLQLRGFELSLGKREGLR